MELLEKEHNSKSKVEVQEGFKMVDCHWEVILTLKEKIKWRIYKKPKITRIEAIYFFAENKEDAIEQSKIMHEGFEKEFSDYHVDLDLKYHVVPTVMAKKIENIERTLPKANYGGKEMYNL